MRFPRTLLSALAVLSLAACDGGKDSSTPKKEEGHSHGEHDLGPHGGELLELAGGEFHVEIMHDHDGGSMKVWVLDKDAKKTLMVRAPAINLLTKDGPVQFNLEPDSALTGELAECWKGSHSGLKTDPWNGRIKIRIGDKTYDSALEEEGHKH
jgi:hypothetical protein